MSQKELPLSWQYWRMVASSSWGSVSKAPVARQKSTPPDGVHFNKSAENGSGVSVLSGAGVSVLNSSIVGVSVFNSVGDVVSVSVAVGLWMVGKVSDDVAIDGIGVDVLAPGRRLPESTQQMQRKNKIKIEITIMLMIPKGFL